MKINLNKGLLAVLALPRLAYRRVAGLFSGLSKKTRAALVTAGQITFWAAVASFVPYWMGRLMVLLWPNLISRVDSIAVIWLLGLLGTTVGAMASAALIFGIKDLYEWNMYK